MRIAAIILALLIQPLVANSAPAGPLGTLQLVIGGTPFQMVIPDSTAGQATWWNLGPVALLAVGPNGGIVRLEFDEDGVGATKAASLAMTDASGGAWADLEDTLTVTLTRAANAPPNFDIAGTFKGELARGERRIGVSGRFQALLPRRDFAPTPPPN
jgi:hypothetical protein